jgi:hypothetical protein
MLDKPQSFTMVTAIFEVEVSGTTRSFTQEEPIGMEMHSSDEADATRSPNIVADSRFILPLSAV